MRLEQRQRQHHRRRWRNLFPKVAQKKPTRYITCTTLSSHRLACTETRSSAPRSWSRPRVRSWPGSGRGPGPVPSRDPYNNAGNSDNCSKYNISNVNSRYLGRLRILAVQAIPTSIVPPLVALLPVVPPLPLDVPLVVFAGCSIIAPPPVDHSNVGRSIADCPVTGRSAAVCPTAGCLSVSSPAEGRPIAALRVKRPIVMLPLFATFPATSCLAEFQSSSLRAPHYLLPRCQFSH